MKKLSLFIVLAVASSLACAIPGLNRNNLATINSVPVVTISNVSAGLSFELGQEVEILSNSIDAAGVVRTELLIDGKVIWVDANADPQPDTPFVVAQPWTPEVPGSHVILVKAYSKDNVAGQSEPLTVEVGTAAPQTVEEQLPAETPEPAPARPTETPVSNLQDAPTVLPSATPSPVKPAMASATLALPTPSVTPTAGVFVSTGLVPEGRFKDIWEELGAGKSRLGYPTGAEFNDRNFARQYFERGLMYWWDNPNADDYIWVIDSPVEDLKSGTTWNRYPDEWEGEDDYACDAARANAEKGPVRGFGHLWCERPELQVRLGKPIQIEAGSGGNPPYGHVQFFQGGIMLYNPINSEVYLLFDQGDWQRFGW